MKSRFPAILAYLAVLAAGLALSACQPVTAGSGLMMPNGVTLSAAEVDRL
ncbi:MAG: hypothetical protein WCQ50_07740 [Spirochaetota bacterium]